MSNDRIKEWETELVQHQAEQYRKIQEYDRLVAENAKLREALQEIANAAVLYTEYKVEWVDEFQRIARAALA